MNFWYCMWHCNFKITSIYLYYTFLVFNLLQNMTSIKKKKNSLNFSIQQIYYKNSTLYHSHSGYHKIYCIQFTIVYFYFYYYYYEWECYIVCMYLYLYKTEISSINIRSFVNNNNNKSVIWYTLCVLCIIENFYFIFYVWFIKRKWN